MIDVGDGATHVALIVKGYIQERIVIDGISTYKDKDRLGYQLNQHLCWLEMIVPETALDDMLISILVAVARHSPTSAGARD